MEDYPDYDLQAAIDVELADETAATKTSFSLGRLEALTKLACEIMQTVASCCRTAEEARYVANIIKSMVNGWYPEKGARQP